MIRNMEFKDYFSDGSEDYRAYRPGYPEELFHYLSSLTPAHERAWDCATGSGQTALALSKYYPEVIATDASQNQIMQAQKKQGIIYRVERAEQPSFEDDSVDLITVAQALHWFDIDAFSSEAGRVLKSGGILAAWTYGLLDINPEVNIAISDLYGSVLDGFWPPERRLIEEGYKSIQLPFEEIQPPDFRMETEWDLPQLVGYLCTWSAVKKYEAVKGINPVRQRHEQLARLWGHPGNRVRMQWPLSIRIWVKA